MDDRRFDALTRTVGSNGGTRRRLLRFMAGSAFAGTAARLGLAEAVEAKPEQHHPKQRTHQPRGSEVWSEGKGKGKGKGKHHHPPSTPDPPCPDGQGQCSDGACVPFDQCCSDQIRCSDGSCVNLFDCCPDEQRCSAELCIKKELCCPDAIPGLCNECYEEVCDNGRLTCRHTPGCCPAGFVVCPATDGGCCPGGEYVTVNYRPFCARTWGSRVYCDSATGQ